MEKEKRDREALNWIIALHDRPGDPDLGARAAAWRAADLGNDRAFREAERTWTLLGDIPSRSGTRDRRRRLHPAARRGYRPAAVAIACAACIAVFFLPGVLLRITADYTTGTAEMRHIKLEDGSQVSLGAESALAVAYGGNRREVRLLKGTAFFEVTPDPGRPFVVEADDVETTVTGTRFEVVRGKREVAVAVSGGTVSVSGFKTAQTAPARLQAGERIRIAADGSARRGSVAPGDVASWRTGYLAADDEPVAGVVETLDRYYGGSFVVLGSRLADSRVTGAYRLDDPVAALEAVAAAHGAVVRRFTPWIVVMSEM